MLSVQAAILLGQFLHLVSSLVPHEVSLLLSRSENLIIILKCHLVIPGVQHPALPAPAGQLCGHQPASVHQEQEHQGPDRRDRPAQAPRREEDGTQALVTAAGTGQSLRAHDIIIYHSDIFIFDPGDGVQWPQSRRLGLCGRQTQTDRSRGRGRGGSPVIRRLGLCCGDCGCYQGDWGDDAQGPSVMEVSHDDSDNESDK